MKYYLWHELPDNERRRPEVVDKFGKILCLICGEKIETYITDKEWQAIYCEIHNKLAGLRLLK